MSFYANKVVLITGGSAGLGLHLARELCEEHAAVIIVGRNAERLSAAAKQLGETTRAIQADVTSDEEVAAMIEEIREKYGRLDVLINCVGRSTRGLPSETSPAEFQDLWNINFLTLVRCTQAALPLLRESKGSIINIGSLASKTASPNMGAYPATKFAVAAYSQQLRIELASEGIHVMLVCPGPIQRDDAGTRYNEAASELPDSAKKPGGGTKLNSLDPRKLSQAILAACQRRRKELVLPRKAKFLFVVAEIWPAFGDWLLRKSSLR